MITSSARAEAAVSAPFDTVVIAISFRVRTRAARRPSARRDATVGQCYHLAAWTREVALAAPAATCTPLRPPLVSCASSSGSRLTASPRGAMLPGCLHLAHRPWVAGQLRVAGDEGDAFAERLGQQQAVEGVFVER